MLLLNSSNAKKKVIMFDELKYKQYLTNFIEFNVIIFKIFLNETSFYTKLNENKG
jgi:hypothetical protein